MGALPAFGQTTLTMNDFSYRSTSSTDFFGTPSEGELVIDPDSGFVVPGGGARILEVPLRWQNIDLDGDTFADDYINFTLRFTGNEGQVAVSNQGVGLKLGSTSTSDNLDDGEEILVELVNPVLSPGLAGAAVIDGFTEAGFGGGGIADPSWGHASFEVNGIASDLTVGNGDSTYKYGVTNVDLLAPTTSAFFRNVVRTAIGATIPTNSETATMNLTNRVRQFDFQITYDPSGTPVTPAVTFTSEGTEFRENANLVYQLGGGGAIVGSIDINPDAGFDLATDIPPGGSVSYDIPLRWSGIDLDGVGVDDDYFNFIFRVHSLPGSGARLSGGNGIGFNGGGTWGLDAGEGIGCEVVDIELKPGIVGAVEFDGFLGAAMITVGNAGAGLSTVGDASLDINGVTKLAAINGTGYTVQEQKTAFFPTPVEGVTFDNPLFNQETGGSETTSPTVHPRNFDLQFSYLAEGTPAGIPEKCFSVAELNLRSNIGVPGDYLFNGTNTTEGTIAAPAGVDNTIFTNNEATQTFPVRWTLDLDGDTIEDEWVDFDVVVTAKDTLGEDGLVSIAAEGLGVVGGVGNNMDDGESLTYTITNISLDPSVPGIVEFGGFSGGQYIASGSGTPDTTGSADAEVAGNAVPTIELNKVDGGYTNAFGGTGVFPRVDSLVFDNVVLTSGSVTPNLRVRGISFMLCYDADGVAASTDMLVVDSAVYDAGTLTVTTSGATDGATYHLEYTDDLDNAFAAVADSDEVASGDVVVHVITTAGGKGFFRVVSGSGPVAP